MRKFGSADLTLYATNNLRFHFDYYRPSDEGNTFTTRGMDFFGSPSFWGTFARANPYVLLAPLTDDTNRITGGFDYTLEELEFPLLHRLPDLHGKHCPEQRSGRRAEHQSNRQLPYRTTERILPGRNSAACRRRSANFNFVGKPLPRLEWRGSYMYYRYEGPVKFDASV